jgi:KaiC/GvpD/RAD55 family RecA-like ATPase
MMSKYIYVKQGLNSIGEFVEKSEWNEEFTSDTDWYISTYYYEQDALDYFKVNGRIKGFKNVKTDKIWFDFDSTDLERAKGDAKTVISRLKDNGIKESAIDVYFSGSKGFTVETTVDKMLNRTQVEHLACNVFGKGLETFDKTMYDENQIFRVPNTKHPKSGLYKVQLSIKQLNLPIEKIKEYAVETRPIILREHGELTPALLEIKQDTPKKVNNIEELNFDISRRPPHWKDYKWALLNAHQVKESERHNALLIIAATCKGLGYDESLTRFMCQSFDEKFCAATGKPPVEDLDDNILPSIFTDDWNGGQYSHKNNKWLQEYCERIGVNVNTATDDLTIKIEDAVKLFKDYATNIDKLTINTGIQPLDKHLRMTIGMVVGIVAAPGVGKTSISLQILNAMSNKGEQSIFFSYDMYHALVIQKLIQKHFKDQPDYIFEKFKTGDKEYEELVYETLKTEYKNVEFCFDTGQTPDDIERTIRKTKDETGKDVRLIVIDYNELVLSDLSDPTQSSAFVIQKLRKVANQFNCCVVVLLQPNKMAGTPADELTSYRSAKGSSAIEQAISVMLGVSRPGYDPRHPENDKFMVINCLKNRMGRLFNVELSWDGLTGTVAELTNEQKELLRQIEETKKLEKEGKSSDDGW